MALAAGEMGASSPPLVAVAKAEERDFLSFFFFLCFFSDVGDVEEIVGGVDMVMGYDEGIRVLG